VLVSPNEVTLSSASCTFIISCFGILCQLSVKNFYFEVFQSVPVLPYSYHCIIYDFGNQTELVGSFCGDLYYITL